jgi:hypothetical protein
VKNADFFAIYGKSAVLPKRTKTLSVARPQLK